MEWDQIIKSNGALGDPLDSLLPFAANLLVSTSGHFRYIVTCRWNSLITAVGSWMHVLLAYDGLPSPVLRLWGFLHCQHCHQAGRGNKVSIRVALSYSTILPARRNSRAQYMTRYGLFTDWLGDELPVGF